MECQRTLLDYVVFVGFNLNLRLRYSCLKTILHRRFTPGEGYEITRKPSSPVGGTKPLMEESVELGLFSMAWSKLFY